MEKITAEIDINRGVYNKNDNKIIMKGVFNILLWHRPVINCLSFPQYS